MSRLCFELGSGGGSIVLPGFYRLLLNWESLQ